MKFKLSILFIFLMCGLITNQFGYEPSLSKGTCTMNDNSPHFAVPDRDSQLQRFKRFRDDPELLELQQQLRQINAWDIQDVQQIYFRAVIGTSDGHKRAIIRLKQLLESYKKLKMTLDDAFMPYALAHQINNGGRGIHILNQAYNLYPYYVDPYTFATIWLVLGKQGGGKSTAVYYMISQLSVPILILDPKNTWRFRATELAADVIEPEYLSFDFDFDEERLPLYLHSIAEGIAHATGLQYGQSVLFECIDIVLRQRRGLYEATGQHTPVCLKDIYLALSLCDNKGSKRSMYIESTRAAIEMLLGKNRLFENRGGLPLDLLMEGRYILPCQYLSVVQSRFLGWLFLNYLQFKSQGQPEMTQLKRLLVFDDASKFISKSDTVFGTGAQTGVYLHPLSILRSSGCGLILVDQLADPIQQDVKQLANNWLIIGGMRGTKNQPEVSAAMGLTVLQTEMIGRLQKKEAIVFCASTYPKAIHGFIPEVQL